MAVIQKNSWFEEHANSNNLDYSRAIDSTTTVDGLLKIIAEEMLFKEDVFNGIKYFKGQILRVQILSAKDPDFFHYSFSVQNAIKGSGGTIKAYIVRIPGLHSLLPIPNTYGTEKGQEQDAKIIDLYKPYFIGHEGSNYSLGDFVEVTFGNMLNYTDGRIVNSFSPETQGNGTNSPSDLPKAPLQKADTSNRAKYGPGSKSQNGAFSKFEGNPNSGANLNDPSIFMSPDEAYENGNSLGKIQLKPVGSNKNKALAVPAANDFIKMQDEYSKQNSGSKLVINETWRSKKNQEDLIKKYGEAPKGGAAPMGYSLHQTGIAIDINTDGYDSKTYDWLWNNAENYNFFNFGKYYISGRNPKGEPWHWEHLPKGQKRRDQFVQKNPSVASKDDV